MIYEFSVLSIRRLRRHSVADEHLRATKRASRLKSDINME